MKSLEKMETLIQKIKDPKKKEIIQNKINKLKQLKYKQAKRKDDGGMVDQFTYQAKGHIMVDKIDENGQVIENLIDKENLVVDGAEKIILRALSGDTGRTIYKNRVPKGGSQEVFVSESKLNGKKIIENGKIAHDPSILWSEADDELFEVEYAYYPNVVYIEEFKTPEAGKRAFRVYSSDSTNLTALPAETYSTYSNLFIGLGEGLGKSLVLNSDEVRKSSEDEIEASEELINMKKVKSSVEYDFKGELSVVAFKTHKSGAIATVSVDGEVKETVDTLSKDEEGELVVKVSGKGSDEKVTVKIEFNKAAEGISNSEVHISDIKTDELKKEMKTLFKEFKNYKTKFDTDIFVNSTPEEPYVAKVPHHPVIPSSLEVTHKGLPMTKKSSEENLKNGEYFYNRDTGNLHFGSAVTNVALRYEITGELTQEFDLGSVTTETIVQTDIVPETKNDVVIGVPSSINPTFILPNQNIHEGTLKVLIDDVLVLENELVSVDYKNGTFKLAQAENEPLGNVEIKASYTYDKEVTTPVEVFKVEADQVITPDTLRVQTDEGVPFTKAKKITDLENGSFMLKMDEVPSETPEGEPIKVPTNVIYVSMKHEEKDTTKFTAVYKSDAFKGHDTGYRRALIQKPKGEGKYPWFELDSGSIRFVAQFHENEIKENITIREMGLFDGPRVDDNFLGFPEYPVEAFSLVRVPETVKNVEVGIQVTWVITLINEEGKHYKGGNN